MRYTRVVYVLVLISFLHCAFTQSQLDVSQCRRYLNKPFVIGDGVNDQPTGEAPFRAETLAGFRRGSMDFTAPFLLVLMLALDLLLQRALECCNTQS